MAASPRWKVYMADGEYIASTKRIETAAVIVAGVGAFGMTIRDGHRLVVWTEGKDGKAAQSHDAVDQAARRVHERINAPPRNLSGVSYSRL